VFSSTDDSILLTIYLYIQLPACVQKAASRGAETVLPMAKRPVDTFGPNASRMHALQPVRDGEPAGVYAAACRRRDARTTPPLRWIPFHHVLVAHAICTGPRGGQPWYAAAGLYFFLLLISNPVRQARCQDSRL
jgi:hypothetical protein